MNKMYEYKFHSSGVAIFWDDVKRVYIVSKAKKLPNWKKKSEQLFADYEPIGEVFFEDKNLQQCANFIFKFYEDRVKKMKSKVK